MEFNLFLFLSFYFFIDYFYFLEIGVFFILLREKRKEKNRDIKIVKKLIVRKFKLKDLKKKNF